MHSQPDTSLDIASRIVAIFDMLGPYHIARLNALAAQTTTLGIEVASRSQTYSWDKVEAPTLFERKTLFDVPDSTLLTTGQIRRALTDALAIFKPDVVLVPGWATSTALIAAQWCWASGVPTVVMSESTIGDASRAAWKEAIKRCLVETFDAGLVGGTPQRAYLALLGIPEASILLGYNAIDNAYFDAGATRSRASASSERVRLGLPESYFLASARFIEIKNLDRLLEAYACFRRLRPASATRLVLLGDGVEAPRLKSLRSSLGLADTVVMPGFKQYGDLPVYYGLAKAFVHVSRVEPWGLVVNEAMASRLPVLVSRECGCAEDLVADGRNGYVVAHDDIAAIATRMVEIDDANAERLLTMGEASFDIVSNYGPERFARGALDAAALARARPSHRPTLVGSAVSRAMLWAR